MVMPNSVAAHLSIPYGFRGPCVTVSSACASGAAAIGEGVELLRRGAADLVLAVGGDAMLTYNAICSYLRLDAMSRNVQDPARASRPFDRHDPSHTVNWASITTRVRLVRAVTRSRRETNAGSAARQPVSISSRVRCSCSESVMTRPSSRPRDRYGPSRSAHGPSSGGG